MVLYVLLNLIGTHPQRIIYIRIYACLCIKMQWCRDKGQPVVGDTSCLCDK